MIEPPEVFVLGPYSTNMFGKPGDAHAQVRVRAARPVLLEVEAVEAGDAHREHEVVGLKAGRPDHAVELVLGAVPSGDDAAVTIPVGVMRAIASVTSSTFSRSSVGR